MASLSKTAALVCVSVGLLASGAALACGQVAPVAQAKPGAEVEIRGYGYGYEGGDRLVNLRWAHGRSSAGTAIIDAEGNFNASVKVPDAVGLHTLLVSEGEGDMAPVEVSVPVVAPWHLQALERLVSVPIGIASLLVLGVLGLLLAQIRSRRKLRLGA
jgi:hypothetical protein